MSKQGAEGSTRERKQSLCAQKSRPHMQRTTTESAACNVRRAARKSAPESRLQERVVRISARLEQPRKDRPFLSRQRRPLSRRPLHHSCQPAFRLRRWSVCGCAPPSHLPTRRRQRRQFAGSASVLARARAAVELHEGRLRPPAFERRDLRHATVCGRGEQALRCGAVRCGAVRCGAQDGRGRGSYAPCQSRVRGASSPATRPGFAPIHRFVQARRKCW